MIKITQKKDCCGCGACAQACGKKCISMFLDEEGFFYPVVDMESCIECGVCEKVCPILNKAELSGTAITAYAAFSNDGDIRNVSSSGGVFSVLAEEILRKWGVVFGAAFAEDFSVHHVMIERIEDLPMLRGSKYVQSRIEDTYHQAKAVLETGRTVLFSGVACQIAGLKAFLGKKYENLYTVDVLCHGVPSLKIWQMYCEEQEKHFGGKITGVSFRNKITGWNGYSIEQTFRNGERYCQAHLRDQFMCLYFSNICLRPSCHNCRFKDIPRMSDLTVGDAWGVEEHMPDMADDRGTSVVLVNTEKGQGLWNEIIPRMTVRQGEVDTLLPADAEARRSVRMHPNRKRFFTAVSQGANMAHLRRLAQKSWLRRLLSTGKRCIKRLKQKHS